MYKFPSKQTGISDFGMPLGMKLDPENRWVKKAELIPWEDIELRYAALFKNRKGNVAKPLRLALGALLIQKEYEYPDTEVPLQIQETPCLQYFCGMPGYEDKIPFDSSLMVYFRKRLTPEILGEINEMIIRKAEGKPQGDDNKPEPPADGGNHPDGDDEQPNDGTLLIDASCAPQNIRYPQDSSLLNEAREKLEKMVDILHDPKDGEKPRTYRQKAYRDYVKIAKKKNKTTKALRKGIRQQLQYIRRDLIIVDNMLGGGKSLPRGHEEQLETIKTLYEQQLYMYNNEVHSVDDRIVSISQPWVRPIVRGKAKAKCEFGAKIDISVSNGFTRLERLSFDAFNESEDLIGIVESYRAREGHYPERVLVDQIYRNRENLAYCKEHNIQISGKPLGRPKRDPDKAQRKRERKDGADRIEVERKLSHAKGSFGLGLIRTRLKGTSQTAIALSIIALNISHAGRVLPALFAEWFMMSVYFTRFRKLGIVQ